MARDELVKARSTLPTSKCTKGVISNCSSGLSASGENHSPLEQFEITPFVHFEVGSVDLAFTNSSLAMVITIAVITLFLTLSVNTRSIIPSRVQLISELSYGFIAQLLKDTVGEQGRKYFPFVFTIFMFVLIGNMVGMLPYSFTFTSRQTVFD
jgi:F-type H+-transporting ATPase subunit a